MKVIITKLNNGWDVVCWDGDAKKHVAWASDKRIAYEKARIFADHYRNDIGQSLNIEIKED